MSKIINVYKDNIDRCWYRSSNIVYSECIDKQDELKVLNVVFSNGSQYQYTDVKVMDYLMFREAESQGKGLDQFIKKNGYPYRKMENADLDLLNEEREFIQSDGITIEFGGHIRIITNEGEVIYDSPEFLGLKEKNIVVDMIKALGHNVRVVEK